jgi:hypothetical protein
VALQPLQTTQRADAANQALQRINELFAEGDSGGYAIWKRILGAVTELSRTTPAEGGRVSQFISS